MRGCNEKPAGSDPYFGQLAQFEQAQKVRKARRVREYLDSLDCETAEAVHRDLRNELRDIGL